MSKKLKDFVLIILAFAIFTALCALFIALATFILISIDNNHTYTTINTVDSYINHYKTPMWCGKVICNYIDKYDYYVYDSVSHQKFDVVNKDVYDIVMIKGPHNVEIYSNVIIGIPS